MKQKLELALPFPRSLITQAFGANANVSYERDGLKGHTSQDWGAAYGAPILNLADDAYCYSTMSKDNPDPSKYRAVFTLVETETGIYEISYGHCSEIYAVPGQTYKTGDVLALVGNTGTVFAGNHEVTKAERLAGSKAGAHLHGPQVRPVRKMKIRSSKKQYLSDGNGLLKIDGFYFEVLDYTNGYNGCVNPEPFYVAAVPVPPAPYRWERDLYLGRSGSDVRELQKYLNKHGFVVATSGAGSPGQETDYYGPRTMSAVSRYQKAFGIYPTLGYFGAKTRAFINSQR